VGAIQVEKNDGQRLFADGPEVGFQAKDESDFGDGSVLLLGNHDNFGALEGRIGEVVLYDRVLGTARRTIVQNALAAKFGATLTSGDRYAGDQSGNGDYDRGVFGIGAESSSDFHNAAQAGGLRFEVENGLDGGSDPNAVDGDYLLAGHKTPANTVNVSDISGLTSPSLDARMERAWYVDETDSGTGLTVNVTVDLSEAGLSGPAGTAVDYVLLQRNADASNGTDWTSLGTGDSKNGDEITFSGVGLTDGKKITIGTTDQVNSPLGGAKIVLRGTAGNEGDVGAVDNSASGGDAGYVLLGPPKKNATFGDLASDTDPQLIEFNIPGPMIYEYDPSTDNFTEVTSSSTSMTPGKGFSLFIFDNKGSTDADPVDPTLPIRVTAGSVPTANVSRSPNENYQWVFLANPFAVPYDLDAITASGNNGLTSYSGMVQVWESTTGGSETSGSWIMKDLKGVNADTMGVGQGFFLECTDATDGMSSTKCPTTVTIPTSGRVSGDRSVIGYKSQEAGASEQSLALDLALSVENSGETVARDEAARVVLHEDATDGWGQFDATKLAPFLWEYATVAPLSQAGDSLRRAAQAGLPWPSTLDPVEVPLQVTTVGISGTATLRLDEAENLSDGWSVEVVDTKGTADSGDDEVHPLVPGGEGYSFTLEGDKADSKEVRGSNEGADKSSAQAPQRPPGGLTLSERLTKTTRGRTAAALAAGSFSGRLSEQETEQVSQGGGKQGESGALPRNLEKAGSGAGAAAKKRTTTKTEAEAPETRLVLRITPSRSALPVELANLSAQLDGEGALISWQTASETNNAGFYVEHQRLPAGDTLGTPKSSAWREVGFVDGAGTTTEAQSYRYRVEGLEYGRHVFRLRQVDTDGSETRTDPVRIQRRLEAAYAVGAPYPNPTSRRATLPVTVREAQPVTIRIYDVLGRRVRSIQTDRLTEQDTRKVRITTEGLSSGQYFVRVRGSDFAVTKRLTVVR
jgi:hypothetical protein